jgi:hypothetical protein
MYSFGSNYEAEKGIRNIILYFVYVTAIPAAPTNIRLLLLLLLLLSSSSSSSLLLLLCLSYMHGINKYIPGQTYF